MYKNIRYNAATDFAPVTLFADQPMTLSARKDFPASNMPEFSAYLKANAAKLQYGSAGTGSTTHLACSLVNSTIGVNVTHVPYRGSAPVERSDRRADRLHVQQHRQRHAADQGRQGEGDRQPVRCALAADAGACDREGAGAEGLRDFDLERDLPAQGTPAAIVKRLGDATNQAMDTPATKARMQDIGVDGVAPERRSPEYLAKFVVDEIARWAGPIKDAGLQVD
jgi:tripartite-type tricarboxylate transporter receptor subunit TctC